MLDVLAGSRREARWAMGISKKLINTEENV